MIFDDDTRILEILDIYFSMRNFEVQSFSEPILCSVSKDSNYCLNPCADIIIIDFQMPRINGIELLNHQAQRRCPINIKNKAIMSGTLPDEYIDKMKGLADTFFQKPVHMQKLYAWTKECVSRNDLSQPLGSYDDVLSKRLPISEIVLYSGFDRQRLCRQKPSQ
jgi:DNA-binding response OmpR family regulator